MTEYLEREKILQKLNSNSILKELAYNKVCGLSVYDVIKNFPTANVNVTEIKHGYWHLLDNCANEGVYCSVCNKKVYKTSYANQKIKSKYCPNCGAKMDGDKNVRK